MNPQEKIRHKLAFLRTQHRISNDEEKIVIADEIDKLEQRLKDLNNMGKRQKKVGNPSRSVG
jgi:hypothetical protein